MEISAFMDGRPAEMTEVEKTGWLKVGGRWMGRTEEAEREKKNNPEMGDERGRDRDGVRRENEEIQS